MTFYSRQSFQCQYVDYALVQATCQLLSRGQFHEDSIHTLSSSGPTLNQSCRDFQYCVHQTTLKAYLVLKVAVVAACLPVCPICGLLISVSACKLQKSHGCCNNCSMPSSSERACSIDSTVRGEIVCCSTHGFPEAGTTDVNVLLGKGHMLCS